MGRDKRKRTITQLAVFLEEGNYENALSLLQEMETEIDKFSAEEAKEVLNLIEAYQKRLEDRKQEILTFLVNKEKVKKSYLK